MTAATCSVLAGVFPLILIAVVADRRSIHLNLRRLKLYRLSVLSAVSACLLGLVVVVVGVQMNGLAPAQGLIVWTFFALAVLLFALSVVMNIATQEGEEDALQHEISKRSPRRRRHMPAANVARRRWDGLG